MSRRVSRAVESDLRGNIVPTCIYWNTEEVVEWMEEAGFSRYSDCFRRNFVNGRKLIAIDCSALPSMGINDFEDMKKITKAIRGLLGIPKIGKREIAMKDPKYAYIEIKRRSGITTDNITYQDFVRKYRLFFTEHARKLSS